MLLETSRRYNPEIESITFLKDLSYNRDDFAKAGGALDRCFFLSSVLCSYIFSFLMWAAGNSLWGQVRGLEQDQTNSPTNNFFLLLMYDTSSVHVFF